MTFSHCHRLKNMNRRTLVLAIATPLVLAALEPNKTESVHYSYPMQSGSRLTVENMNGSIEISGWDQNMIDITATKHAETDQMLPPLKGGAAGAAVGAKYRLKAPRRTGLAEIRSSNGSIRVTETEGAANLRTSNGSVNASKTRGRLAIGPSTGSGRPA